MRRHLMIALLSVLMLSSLVQAATNIKVAPDKDSGIYDLGQTVTWKVEVDIDKKPGTGKAQYRILSGGLTEIAKGDVDLADGKASVTGTRADPGTLLLEIKAGDASANGGAVFAPDKIAAAGTPPDDFDAFWKAKVDALHAIPINVQITKGESGQPGVEYYKITMDNINGSKIQGQLAKPVGNGPFPALLQVQYAGVYKLDRNWVLNRAKQGWLALNIIAHDLPIDETPEFYKKQSDTVLKDYPSQGSEDREKSYFLRMFLSCYRAVDYLTERPDWNKKSLLVEGTSQGGYQTLVIAGMHPAITAFAACVPAGCDLNGRAVKRAPGWPNWVNTWSTPKKTVKMAETCRYYDAVYFAQRIKAPGIIALGLIDVTCPPEGVLAASNQIKSEHKNVIMPGAAHSKGHNAYYPIYNSFLEVHRKK